MSAAPTVREIAELINQLAPFDTCEDYDNVGLLMGKPEARVTRVLVALDATLPVVREAEKWGAELIVTHHPLFFHARKNLVEGNPEADIVCAMVRANIALISAHTNLDIARGGVSDALVSALRLDNVRGEAFVRMGDLPAPMTARALAAECGTRLHTAARLYGDAEKPVRVLAVAGGAADTEYELAMRMGADAFLTGEVRHHTALSASALGFPLIDCGHFATEVPVVPVLKDYLQNALNALQYDTAVAVSEIKTFELV